MPQNDGLHPAAGGQPAQEGDGRGRGRGVSLLPAGGALPVLLSRRGPAGPDGPDTVPDAVRRPHVVPDPWPGSVLPLQVGGPFFYLIFLFFFFLSVSFPVLLLFGGFYECLL